MNPQLNAPLINRYGKRVFVKKINTDKFVPKRVSILNAKAHVLDPDEELPDEEIRDGYFHKESMGKQLHGSVGREYDTRQPNTNGLIIDNLAIEEKRLRKSDLVTYNKYNLIIDYDVKNAQRLTNPDCYINYNLDNPNILYISHIMCLEEGKKGQGKLLLLDVIKVLKEERKLGFNIIQLMPVANLDPTKSTKTFADLVTNYKSMNFGDVNADGIQSGNVEDIKSRLEAFKQSQNLGGSKRQKKTKKRKRMQRKTKRRQKGNKRRQTKKRGKR